MKPQRSVYRKNFSLIIAFFALISVSLVIGLFISYNLTFKYVENEFASKKGDVLEETLKPYTDFFSNRIPEITLYQGYLTNASAEGYSDSVFRDYPFVKKINFYEIAIESRASLSDSHNNLDIELKSVYQYQLKNGHTTGVKREDVADANDFNEMAGKLNDYIANVDTSRAPAQDEIFKAFYNVAPDKISYMNILRRQDVKIYRDMQEHVQPGIVYQQNMMTFILDPRVLKIKNVARRLYQSVSIKPVVYYPLDIDPATTMTTDVPFPGALANYKLFFKSSKSYITAEVNRRFMPIGGVILLIYIFLMLIGYLIYRNLKVNMRLFKLQYDFINNFTHEFKTPVSVIKIAGSNLRGDSELTERQRKHYGKILDEEADKLNELMNKLLSFTQLENKSIDIKKEQINIKDFVKRYIESFKIKYPDFKVDADVKNVKTISSDPVLLGSVFQNLMENAYKYSHPQKKELHITVTNDKRENIVFTFADKGIGIPKNELNNIFNKFYRIENKYNQNGSVGLGLAFCKELVNFMNGEITVNSKVDEGSEFTVTLPNDN
jgi:two-component system, OmpR family, phosphate regulon sensor histidine kinase PhoR